MLTVVLLTLCRSTKPIVIEATKQDLKQVEIKALEPWNISTDMDSQN